MQWTKRFQNANWNKSSLTYTFDNGSFIEFFSADQPDKLRGARRDVLFINECNNVNFEAYQQLAVRTRRFIYLDYNPTSEFWVHTELINEPDTSFVILTYKDNEALEPSIVKEIEKAREKAKTSSYWANWWKVYGLGQIGSLEGVVFNNWKVCDMIPEGAEYLGAGLDFGFTNDPTALVEMYRYNGALYLNQLIYQTGLLNSQIASIIKSKCNLTKAIIADSAEPKSIEDIRRLGINIKPALKGRDSITTGINTLQEFDIFITKNSTDLIKEFRNYTWDKDREGKTLNKPIDLWNHGIDAVRYIGEQLRLPKWGADPW